MATREEIESLEGLLRKLPQEDQAEAFRILYGNMPEAMSIHPAVIEAAETGNATGRGKEGTVQSVGWNNTTRPGGPAINANRVGLAG